MLSLKGRSKKARKLEPREKPRKCIFNDQLQFLNKLYDARDTVDSLDADTGQESLIEEDTVPQRPTGDTVGATNSTTNKTNKTANAATSNRTRKHCKSDEVELKIMKALEPEKPNSKMSFFHSMLPHLDRFDEIEFLQFQMGVL